MPTKDYEDNVSYEIARRAKVCVSYDGMGFVRDDKGCAREVPIRKKAIAGNGGSPLGIALRLPCDGCADPLFPCPWYEANGIDRAAQEMRELREAGARTITALAKRLQEESA